MKDNTIFKNLYGQRSTHRDTFRDTVRNTYAGSKYERHLTPPVYGGKKRRIGAKTRKIGKRGKGKRRGGRTRRTLRKSRGR